MQYQPAKLHSSPHCRPYIFQLLHSKARVFNRLYCLTQPSWVVFSLSCYYKTRWVIAVFNLNYQYKIRWALAVYSYQYKTRWVLATAVSRKPDGS